MLIFMYIRMMLFPPVNPYFHTYTVPFVRPAWVDTYVHMYVFHRCMCNLILHLGTMPFRLGTQSNL